MVSAARHADEDLKQTAVTNGCVGATI